MQVRAQRMARQLDGAPNPIGPCAASSLVQEDGRRAGRHAGQGSSDSSCSASSVDGPTTVKTDQSAKYIWRTDLPPTVTDSASTPESPWTPDIARARASMLASGMPGIRNAFTVIELSPSP